MDILIWLQVFIHKNPPMLLLSCGQVEGLDARNRQISNQQ